MVPPMNTYVILVYFTSMIPKGIYQQGFSLSGSFYMSSNNSPCFPVFLAAFKAGMPCELPAK
jgi:hypothetical protein